MRRRDRFVFVVGRYAVGGAEKQLANLIAHRPQRARDIDVHVITLLPPSSLEVEQRFADAGVRTTLVDRSSLRFPSFFIRLLSEMRRLRPAVVSTFLDSSVGAWGRLAAWLTGVPIIVQSDRQLAHEGTRSHLFLRPLLDRVTTRFLPNANAIAERLVADGVPRRKIRVMPNGVDLRVFDPCSTKGQRGSWEIPEADTVLGYLGRFAREKRVDLLVRAVQALPESARPEHVVLAGDGATMPAVREIVAADRWLSERCRFIGGIDDTPAFLASIDYLVLPSDSEGLPNVVLEAMAMAKPVVATAVSEIPAMVGDTGLVVPPGNVGALAEAIGRMQELSIDQRRERGLRARQRVEQNYDIVLRSADFWDAHLELLRGAEPRQSVT